MKFINKNKMKFINKSKNKIKYFLNRKIILTIIIFLLIYIFYTKCGKALFYKYYEFLKNPIFYCCGGTFP
jgi:hypothetical protein